MRYDVRVRNGDGSEGQFDHEQDEELSVGEYVRVMGMSYEVLRIRPLGPDESDEHDALVEAVWRIGPAQAGYTSSFRLPSGVSSPSHHEV